MEAIINQQLISLAPTPEQIVIVNEVSKSSNHNAFIIANTVDCEFEEIKEQHTIPVFIKDNEPVISHVDFIQAMTSVVSDVYQDQIILKPAVRLSHPIKGRIPDAKDKSAKELLEHEKTIYYERMAFVIEIPGIHDEIDGSVLSLTVGGVKSYGMDNLYNRKGTDEHFKVFIGFQNKVCTNLCVWTDGLMADLKVTSLGQLKACIYHLLANYNAAYQLVQMKELSRYSLTEHQFATLIGKCRMYQHLPGSVKSELPPLLLGDTQLGTVVKDYYRDDSFCKSDDGNINLWRLYNLLTGANKSSYIDMFLERSVNASQFVYAIKEALDDRNNNWFLN